MIEAFWSTEPWEKFGQRKGSLPYGLYPNTRANLNGLGGYNKGFTREILHEMLIWCANNCRDQVTFSDRYGSLHFANEDDRVLFRMFFQDDDMADRVRV